MRGEVRSLHGREALLLGTGLISGGLCVKGFFAGYFFRFGFDLGLGLALLLVRGGLDDFFVFVLVFFSLDGSSAGSHATGRHRGRKHPGVQGGTALGREPALRGAVDVGCLLLDAVDARVRVAGALLKLLDVPVVFVVHSELLFRQGQPDVAWLMSLPLAPHQLEIYVKVDVIAFYGMPRTQEIVRGFIFRLPSV